MQTEVETLGQASQKLHLLGFVHNIGACIHVPGWWCVEHRCTQSWRSLWTYGVDLRILGWSCEFIRN